MKIELPRYSLGEEIANAVTHGIGVLLAIAGLAVLVGTAVMHGAGAGQIVPCVVYGVAMVLMFATSTLYHSFTHPRVKRVFRVLDHQMIFLMIAGSYTPFVLITLRGALGWTLFGIVWGIAAAGMVFEGFFTGRFKRASLALYLAMGWIIVFALKPLLAHMSAGGVRWLVAGRRGRWRGSSGRRGGGVGAGEFEGEFAGGGFELAGEGGAVEFASSVLQGEEGGAGAPGGGIGVVDEAEAAGGEAPPVDAGTWPEARASRR
jgi:hemolysin III